MALPKLRRLVDGLADAQAKLLAAILKKEDTLKLQTGECFPSLSVSDDRHQRVVQRNSSFQRRVKEESSIPLAAESGYDDSSFSSIALPLVEFEVFLSFRGPDTRKGFADCLFWDLANAGIRVFRDNEGLHVGKNLKELLVAITNSKICIPILSKGYASSRWCLQELAQMVECSKLTRLEIFPVFYDVTPSQVQLQQGPYVEALEIHKKQCDPNIVKQWEDALREVGRIKGWELQKATNGHEGELIKLVVRKVLVNLKVHHLNVTDQLVAIDDHVRKILRMLNVDSRDVRIGGIHGMGGIGKTTLAKVVYNQLARNFEYCSFVADIRETSEHRGLEYLQNQLVSQLLKDKAPEITNTEEGIKIIKDRFSGKDVLILLDDLERRTQLYALVGNRCWFGPGSKIIITTRNKDILNVPEIDWTYELDGMEFEPSLQLFSRHAFRRDYPPDDYFGYSEKVIEITGGLPLALENIGSFLSGKSKEVWDSTLKKLEKLPHEGVEKNLRISYDALDDLQKHIFLDIACLFIGYDRRIVVHMWDDSQFFPEEGIEILLLTSLIKIDEDNKIWMHDQLRDLGRKIVYQENKNNFFSGNRSRLWDHHESLSTLEGKKGSESVQALCLEFGSRELYHLTNEAFTNLSTLRFMQINGVDLSGNFENLLSELRWLCWHYCPSRFRPTKFYLKKLVVLDLSWSKITIEWEGWHYIKMAKYLKVVNLTGCIGLSRTPDFSGFAALERLILKGCSALVEIEINTSPDGINYLKSIDIRDCCCIQRLPENLSFTESLGELIIDRTSIEEIFIPPGCLRKLEILSARDCKSLVRVSHSIGYLESLQHLALDNSRIGFLPGSIGELIKLVRLSLKGCRSLTKLPVSIGQLESLSFLDLSGTGIIELPESIGNLRNLKILILEGSCIHQIPPVIGMLEKLEEIHAKSCSNLAGEIPGEVGNLPLLRILSLSDTLIHGLPASISQLIHLHSLDMDQCDELTQLPELPTSLVFLRVSSHKMEEIPDLSDLHDLKYLSLSDNSVEDGSSKMLIQDPNLKWLGMLTKLETLQLCLSRIVTTPTELGLMSRLKKLVLHCVDLQGVLQLPPNLSTLSIGHCRFMSMLVDLSNLKNLLELELIHCPISEIQGLSNLPSLQVLDITDCALCTLDGLRNLVSLRRLILNRCKNLKLVPNLSGLKRLKELNLRECENLVQVEGLSGLESLEVLHISSCRSMLGLDDPYHMKMLKLLEIKDCDKLHETLSSSTFSRLPDITKLKRLDIIGLDRCAKSGPTQLPSLKTLKCLGVEVEDFN